MLSCMIEPRVLDRLVDGLYTDAMLLADEARAYFEELGRAEQAGLDPLLRVGFACESLKVTTRLMHAVAWVLTRRAVTSGELEEGEARAPSRRLGEAPDSDADLLAAMPERVRALVEASVALHRRAANLEAAIDGEAAAQSPARAMQRHLHLSL